MSILGVFAVDRGVFDHPMFAPEPYTEREAWLWLLSAAAWSDKRIRVGHSMVELKRGQLAFATRFMATKWKWAHSRVVRFLKRLETDTMIGTLATHNSTLITICNYNKYAFGRNAAETQTETQTGTQPERARNKEEELKNYNNKEVSKIDAPPTAAPRVIKRALPLPIGWVPSEKAYAIAEQFGQNVQIVEEIFRDYLASSGKLYRDYDAAFHSFIRNQQNFNRGGSSNGVRQSEKRGSIIDAADRAIAKLEREIAAEKQGCSATILSLPAQRLR